MCSPRRRGAAGRLRAPRRRRRPRRPAGEAVGEFVEEGVDAEIVDADSNVDVKTIDEDVVNAELNLDMGANVDADIVNHHPLPCRCLCRCILGLRFCAKNSHGPPTRGFFVVPYIYFDSKKEKMPSSSTLEQRKIFHIDW